MHTGVLPEQADIRNVVYLVINKVNGKCYVGQTRRKLKYRWQRHTLCESTVSNCANGKIKRTRGGYTFTYVQKGDIG
jgi:hypothetical protein